MRQKSSRMRIKPNSHSAARSRYEVTGTARSGISEGRARGSGNRVLPVRRQMVRMDWFNANVIGGVKLRVDRGNVDDANRILDESIRDGESEMQG